MRFETKSTFLVWTGENITTHKYLLGRSYFATFMGTWRRGLLICSNGRCLIHTDAFSFEDVSYPLKFFWLLSTLKGSQTMRHLATLSEVKIFDCLKRSFENASSSVWTGIQQGSFWKRCKRRQAKTYGKLSASRRNAWVWAVETHNTMLVWVHKNILTCFPACKWKQRLLK